MGIDTPAAEPVVTRPHSISQASVDDRGRLKLPSEFLQYLKAKGFTKFFITTTDLRQVRIYPISVWEFNEENVLSEAGEDSDKMERLATFMKTFGDDAEIDASGRLLLPALLREKMELEKQPMFIQYYGSRMNAVSKKVHDEDMQKSLDNLAEDYKLALKRGLK